MKKKYTMQFEKKQVDLHLYLQNWTQEKNLIYLILKCFENNFI
jgi:hypothetical protein